MENENIKLEARNEDNTAYTYRRLRRAIGFLGISLPIVLLILSAVPFFDTKMQPSISHYYYTNLREIFTGTLCAVGLFLIRYKGYGNASIFKNDNLLTNLAGLMAFGVALVPTNPEEGMKKLPSFIPLSAEWLGWLHYGFAAVLFLTFSILAINVFTLGQKKETNIEKSIFNENYIYKVCGYSILFFIVLIPVCAKFELFKNSTLVFEALSLFAFGIAWLIKGRVLGDTGKIGEKLYMENNPKKTEPVLQVDVESIKN